MINEFGEEISGEEIDDVAERVQALGKEEIDLLWEKCGIIADDKKDNRALADWEIEKIKENRAYARRAVHDLLLNIPLREFMGFLSDLD